MKRKRFLAESIISILWKAELGMAVEDVVRQLGVSKQTSYCWKNQYAGMHAEGVNCHNRPRHFRAVLSKLMWCKSMVLS
jgi:putative transposase